MDEQFPHNCPICGERVFGNKEFMVHSLKHPDPREEEIAALRAELAEKEREIADLKSLRQEEAEYFAGRLNRLVAALSARDSELLEMERELDEAVENLRALGQQQMDDFKKHRAELDRYKRAVEPVREAEEFKKSDASLAAKFCKCVEAVKDCIRILGESEGKEGE